MVASVELFVIAQLLLLWSGTTYSSVLTMNAVRLGGLLCAAINGLYALFGLIHYADHPTAHEACSTSPPLAAGSVGSGSGADAPAPTTLSACMRCLPEGEALNLGRRCARRAAVSVRSSIKPDFIVCLEDGKKLKMMKRHLRTTYGLTPEEYRAKWGLPADYPMVAPNYAAQRSDFAKKIGLGKQGNVKRGRKARK